MDRTYAVVGLGYVGLELAIGLSRSFNVIGYEQVSNIALHNTILEAYDELKRDLEQNWVYAQRSSGASVATQAGGASLFSMPRATQPETEERDSVNALRG